MSVNNLNIEEIIYKLEKSIVELDDYRKNVIEQVSRMENICSYLSWMDPHIAEELKQIYVAYRELAEKDERDIKYTMAFVNNMISRLNIKIPIQLKGE